MGDDRKERIAMTKCKDCQYWDVIDSNNGTCHRHAPVPTVAKGAEKDQYALILPATRPEDWCGEGEKLETPRIAVNTRSARA
jgi:hypothetical protein